MSYMEALEAAGATVNDYVYVGDYQGSIYVNVDYQGKNGWVVIGYGSCSVCDPYEAFTDSLGWDHDPTQEQLADFGKDYLDFIEDKETILKKLREAEEWDSEASVAIKFVEKF